MNNEEEKVIESLKNITLSREEKSFIKQSISKHIEAGLVPSQKWYKSEAVLGWFTLNPLYAVPIVLFLIITAGGGTGIVAQKSLPGDALYPFKIHLNENLESMAAVSSESEAEVTLMQATRRLEEVEDLSIQGKLSEAKVEEAKVNFTAKVDALNKNLIKIENRGNSRFKLEINNKLKDKINEHYKAFLEVSKNSTTTPAFIEIFKTRIEESRNTDRDDRDDNEENEDDEFESKATTTIKTTATTTINVQVDTELEIE